MNIPRKSFLMGVPAAILLGLCACSDNGSPEGLVRRSTRQPSPPRRRSLSSDAVRQETAKPGAPIDDLALAAKVKTEIRKESALKASDFRG